MFYEPALSGVPAWQAGADRRLGASMLLATCIILVAASLLRYPQMDLFLPIGDLLLNIVIVETPIEEEPAAEQDMPVESGAGEGGVVDAPVAAPIKKVEVAPGPSRDWNALTDSAIADVLNAEDGKAGINPVMDKRREQAAIAFRPSEAPVKKHIWENVEKDQLGRTLLWSGNCYRVLDDPSGVNRWAFETFGQYSTSCIAGSEKGRNLPWVAEIQERYAYLQNREVE